MTAPATQVTRPRRTFVAASGEEADRLRDAPTDEFVEAMRASYPTEAEYDRMLTRKLGRRQQGEYTRPGLEELSASMESLLRDHGHDDAELSDQRWLAGGASKIQMAFTLTRRGPDGTRTTDDLVVRMEPAESINATSRWREFQLLTAMQGVVPVPRTYWLDDEARWFPEPAIVYALAEGTTTPSESDTRVSGTGTRFGPELRSRIGPEFVAHLAAVHSHDWSDADLSAFDVPEVGTTQSAWWELNRARRVWEEDRGEDLPILEVAANWLERNLPALDHVSVLHGDFRTGNFLFDEDRASITTWLDWERGHLGDRHRDLAWTTTRVFGNLAEDGTTYLVNGLMPEKEFFAEYERLSGLTVDPERMRYFRVFNAYQLLLSTFASAYRVARLGLSHQDTLLTWLEGIAYPIMAEMVTSLRGEDEG